MSCHVPLMQSCSGRIARRASGGLDHRSHANWTHGGQISQPAPKFLGLHLVGWGGSLRLSDHLAVVFFCKGVIFDVYIYLLCLYLSIYVSIYLFISQYLYSYINIYAVS